MQTYQLILWGSITGVLLFCVVMVRLLMNTGRKEFRVPKLEADERSVPEQFWRDRGVTRVKSNGEEKDI